MVVFLSLFIIIMCCLVIWKASDGFETASEYLGRNLSEGVRGATINAIGSSIPELLTTIFFLLILNDQEGFSGGVGTTAGSAIFNSMVIPAAVILAVIFAGKVYFVKVSKKVILRDGIMLLLSEIILLYLLSEGMLYWWHGLILMLMYVVYVGVMFATMKGNPLKKKIQEKEEEKDSEKNSEEKKHGFLGNLIRLNLERLIIGDNKINNKSAWFLIFISTCVVGISSAFLVVACEHLGEALEIQVYFVAVILAAAATSVPDTVLSVKDARKGNYDDAVSNALGSNIFDICFALGFPLFLYTLFFHPIEMKGELLDNINELRVLLLILTAVVFFIFLFSRTLKVFHGVLLLGVYLFFVIFIFGRSSEFSWAILISDYLNKIALFML